MIQRYGIIFILGLIIGYWKYSSPNSLTSFVTQETFKITLAYLVSVLISSIVIFLLGGFLRFLINMKNSVQNQLNEGEKNKIIDFRGKAFSKYILYTGIVMFMLFLSDSCEVL